MKTNIKSNKYELLLCYPTMTSCYVGIMIIVVFLSIQYPERLSAEEISYNSIYMNPY